MPDPIDIDKAVNTALDHAESWSGSLPRDVCAFWFLTGYLASQLTDETTARLEKFRQRVSRR